MRISASGEVTTDVARDILQQLGDKHNLQPQIVGEGNAGITSIKVVSAESEDFDGFVRELASMAPESFTFRVSPLALRVFDTFEFTANNPEVIMFTDSGFNSHNIPVMV